VEAGLHTTELAATAVLVAALVDKGQMRQEMATRLAYPHHKETMVELVLQAQLQRAAEVAVQVPLAALRQPQAVMAATVALARPRQFLEAASLMLVAAAVAVRAAPEVLAEQAAVAMAEPKVQLFKPLTARLILAAVVVVLGLEALLLLEQAARVS